MAPLRSWGVAISPRDPEWEGCARDIDDWECVGLEISCTSPVRSGSVRARFRGDRLPSAFDCGAAAAEDGLVRSAVLILGEETVHHIN
jgi:hypothetical protein